jgi:hypothetical protein
VTKPRSRALQLLGGLFIGVSLFVCGSAKGEGLPLAGVLQAILGIVLLYIGGRPASEAKQTASKVDSENETDGSNDPKS